MSESERGRVVRIYEVALKPDPDTHYDPFRVMVTYTPAEAAQLPPTSPPAVTAAFRAAEALERETHHTPPSREFGRGGLRFVEERVVDTVSAVQAAP